MTATTAQVLAGLAVAASYRYSQHRTAPSDVNSGPIRAEAVDAQGKYAASAPQTLAGAAVRHDNARPRLRAAFKPIDSTAARVSGPRENEFPDSSPSVPQRLVGAVSPDTAPTRPDGVHRG